MARPGPDGCLTLTDTVTDTQTPCCGEGYDEVQSQLGAPMFKRQWKPDGGWPCGPWCMWPNELTWTITDMVSGAPVAKIATSILKGCGETPFNTPTKTKVHFLAAALKPEDKARITAIGFCLCRPIQLQN